MCIERSSYKSLYLNFKYDTSPPSYPGKMFRKSAKRFLSQPQFKVEPNLKPISSQYPKSSASLVQSSTLADKLLQHSTMQSATRFLSGPVRSNLLISRELFRIIAREQQLLPSLQSWPAARQAYFDAFHSLKRKIRLFGVSETVAETVREATWGQVGRGLRKLAELGSFYYIGQLVGQACSFLIN